jgi:ParB family chromosome partitioning protein
MASTQQQASEVPTTLEVAIESIIPNPRQPRRALSDDDPKLLELSASIKEHGLIQPIVVTPLSSSDTSNGWFADNELSSAASTICYQIIAGERRWRASRLAGLSKVPVVVKQVTAQQMLELALIENIQRAALNPIEEALAYQALVQEFGLTQELIAKRVGKDRSTVANSLRLLQLTAKVHEALIKQPEYFSEGHARALIGITREEDQVTAMGKIIALRLNVRQAEELAAQMKAAQDLDAALERISPKLRRSPEMEDLETHFRDALMVKVELKCDTRGKGTVVLHFNNQDELERLYSRLVKGEE